MRKETCAICEKIVYVEDGEDFEWEPGAILCEKQDRFYCAEHKPCCAVNVDGQSCSVEEDLDFEDEDDLEDDFDDDFEGDEE